MALNFGILSQVPSFGQQFAAGQQAAQAQQERNMLRQQQQEDRTFQMQLARTRLKQEEEDRAFQTEQRKKQAAQEEQFNKVADLIRQNGMDPDDPKVLGQFAQAAMQARNPQLVSFVGQMAERAAKRRSEREEAAAIAAAKAQPTLPPGPPLRQEAAAPNALAAPAPAVNALAAPQQPQNLFAGTPFDIGMGMPAPAKAAAPMAAPAATAQTARLAELERQRDNLEAIPRQTPGVRTELERLNRQIERLRPKPLTGDAALLESLGLPVTPEGYKKLADMRRQPAPVTNVNVSTEKKYGEAFAGKIAEVDINKMTTAQGAPALAESANRIIGLVQQGNLFTGPIADVKLNIARALNVVGVDNAEKIANTERLIAATGQSTLDAIKGAGLGTGQGFTDKDLKFLQGVAGGTINLTPQTLTELATLQHRVATKAAEAWNTRRQEMPKDVAQGTGLSMTPITVPPLMQKTAPRPKGVGADWTLMTDKNGARAWVSPDRKQHVEVP